MNKISVRTRVFACLTAVFVIVGLVLTLVRLDTSGSMYEQRAVERWAEKGYTQISIFWLPDEGFVPDAVYSYRQAVNTALESESISANSNNSGTWYDAYSTVTSVSAYTSRTSSSLRAVVTGGNYFYIHSHPLLSGNYYTDSGSSADFCVIDENAAWKLFGAIDVAGMELTVNDHTFVVCGVVRSYGNSVETYTGEDTPTVYMLYSAPIFRERGLTVDCYEAVLPNPVDNFGYGILTETVSGYLSAIENASRYSLSGLWDTLKGLTDTSGRTKSEIYPYWENAARKAQTSAAMILFFEAVFYLLAAVCLVIALIPAVRKLMLAWDRLKTKIRNRIDF